MTIQDYHTNLIHTIQKLDNNTYSINDIILLITANKQPLSFIQWKQQNRDRLRLSNPEYQIKGNTKQFNIFLKYQYKVHCNNIEKETCVDNNNILQPEQILLNNYKLLLSKNYKNLSYSNINQLVMEKYYKFGLNEYCNALNLNKTQQDFSNWLLLHESEKYTYRKDLTIKI